MFCEVRGRKPGNDDGLGTTKRSESLDPRSIEADEGAGLVRSRAQRVSQRIRGSDGGRVTKKKTRPELCTRPPTSIFRGPVNDKTYDYLYKLILVGDGDTGKTSLMTGFAGEDFSTNYVPTIGLDFTIHTIVLDGSRIKLQVWDTAGHQRFRTITQSYYRASHGVIVVYDATREKTYDNVPYWLEEMKKYARPEATVMLVGSKCDLPEEKMVDYRTVKDFADERGIMLMEVSAKEGTNVELAFVTLVAKIIEADSTRLHRSGLDRLPQADFTSMSSEIGVKLH